MVFNSKWRTANVVSKRLPMFQLVVRTVGCIKSYTLRAPRILHGIFVIQPCSVLVFIEQDKMSKGHSLLYLSSSFIEIIVEVSFV
jgi:hypothetical protein